MASLTRRMQRRNVRAKFAPVGRRLRNQVRGRNLGVKNARAPKPYSLPARGSRRTLRKRTV